MPAPDALLDRIARHLTGAAPVDAPDAPAATPETKATLDHIAEVSRNARTTWFGLLALLTFVSVTLMAHKDANFFALGVQTRLPLVGIDVPTRSFFWAAPVLVAAVYAYFHLYLLTLWKALADANRRPARRRSRTGCFPGSSTTPPSGIATADAGTTRRRRANWRG